MTDDLFDRAAMPVPDYELHPERISEQGNRFLWVKMPRQGCDMVRWHDGTQYTENLCTMSVGDLQRSRRYEG